MSTQDLLEADQLDVVDGEHLLVLDVACMKGWQVVLEGIRNNYHLFTLLQAELMEERSELLPSSPKLRAMAKGERIQGGLSPNEGWDQALWTYYQWSGLLPDGQFASFMDVLKRVIGEASPRSIATLDQQRIVLLGPQEVSYSWDAGFVAPLGEEMRASVRVVKELRVEEVEAWLARIQGAAQQKGTTAELNAARPLPSCGPCRAHARQKVAKTADGKRLHVGGKVEAGTTSALGLLALIGAGALLRSGIPERDAVRTVWGLLLGLLALIALPAALTFLFAAARRQKRLDRLQRNPVIHWTYTAEETRTLCPPQALPSPSLLLSVLGILGLTAGVGLLIPTTALFRVPPKSLAFMPLVVTSLMLLAGVVFLLSRRRKNQRLLHSPQDMYLDGKGFYINEEYVPWVASHRVLNDIRVEQVAPLVLLAQFTLFLPSGQTRMEYRIPVPRGEEETALGFLRRLRHGSAT